MTEITQADRLLLADLFDLPQSKAMELFAGKHDENEAIGTKLEALARHREQAAAEERAKIVAYGLGETGAAWSRDVQQFVYAIEAKEHLK